MNCARMMRSGAGSTAIQHDSEVTALLVKPQPGHGRVQAAERKSIVAPPPCACMTGTTARHMWKI
jgi:hypothetical protein